MVRIKLDKLTQEINHYLGLPYWRNSLDSEGLVTKEGVLGGKGNWHQLLDFTKKAAKIEKLDLTSLSKIELYRLQKRHHIGIDCSGLAYHLLDFWYQLQTGKSIQPYLLNPNREAGVKKINVKALASATISSRVESLKDIRTADLIIVDSQKHVLFVVENKNNTIAFVHSSQHTQKRGVSYGKIELSHPSLELVSQQFFDLSQDKCAYTPKFGPQDGVYRINCLK